MLCYKRSGISSVKTESESEIHLFEPHSIIQNKYFNVISNYKTWIGRPLLRHVAYATFSPDSSIVCTC